jgi:FkbM family methyltransferase
LWFAAAPDHRTTTGTALVAGLRVKHLLVGTPVGRVMQRVRWLASAGRRRRHPELWDLYLESERTDLVLRHLVEPTWNCVDCGAHVGSVLASIRSLAPDGHHVAIEADGQKAATLRRRFPDVVVHAVALGSHPGRADLLIDRSRPGFSHLVPAGGAPEHGRTVSVPVARLDDLVHHDVQLIKIDIEGAELSALRGARDLLTRCHPAVLFECGTDESLRTFGYDRAALYSFLVDDHGYAIHSMIDYLYGRPPMTLPEFQKAGCYPYPGFNYLALPAGTPTARRL